MEFYFKGKCCYEKLLKFRMEKKLRNSFFLGQLCQREVIKEERHRKQGQREGRNPRAGRREGERNGWGQGGGRLLFTSNV
jgi:hypothetical protein